MPSKQIKASDFPLLQTCLTDNKEWAERVSHENPGFFANSAKGQSPFLLWIGCECIVARLCPLADLLHLQAPTLEFLNPSCSAVNQERSSCTETSPTSSTTTMTAPTPC